MADPTEDLACDALAAKDAEIARLTQELKEAHETNARLRRLLSGPSHSYTAQFERAEEAERERDQLRGAIRRAGFAVMQTSGDWSIHDVSEKAKADAARELQTVNENVDLSIENGRLRGLLARCRVLIERCTPPDYAGEGRRLVAGIDAALGPQGGGAS